MDRPIGMFDSGFGGLTVARALMDLLPAEDLVYIGDTGRYPYGSKPLADVQRLLARAGSLLVDDFDVPRRSSSPATPRRRPGSTIRAELPVPIIDVVEPGPRRS